MSITTGDRAESIARFTLSAATRAMRGLAVHDRITLLYAVTFAGSLWVVTPPGNAVTFLATSLLAWVAIAIFAVKSQARPSAPTVIFYRVAIVSLVVGSYLLLAAALPLLNPRSLDDALYRIDITVFRIEPAVVVEPLVTPALTEWFAFFYLSYFALLLVFIAPVAVAPRVPRLARELVIGLVLIYALGQTLYVLVPGYGPMHAMPEIFERPLVGGFFYERMLALVRSAGAQKDIFPSVHAAVAVFLGILAYRHRRTRVLGIGWPIIAFFCINIVLATLYLRWHYLVDVVAGVLLGFCAHAAAVVVARREEPRQRTGVDVPWPVIAGRETQAVGAQATLQR